MGNLARVIATQSLFRSSHRGILAAAGLIAGDSLFSLLAGVLIVCQINTSSLQAHTTPSEAWSGLALVGLLGLLAFTYLDGRAYK